MTTNDERCKRCLDRAQRHIRHAIAMAPHDAMVAYLKGIQGEIDETIGALELRIKGEPENERTS